MIQSRNEWLVPVVVALVLIGFLVLIAGPKTLLPLPTTDDGIVYITLEAPYSFEEIFYELRRIDDTFHTDFRNESLRGPFLRESAAKEYLGHLAKLRSTIANKTEPTDDKAINHLLNAREEMLTSEIYFQRALNYGKAGVFQVAYKCDNANEVREATQFYNLSHYHGLRALAQMDNVLGFVPARSLIGINAQKPKFYSDVLSEIAKLVVNNNAALDQFCNATLKSPKTVETA